VNFDLLRLVIITATEEGHGFNWTFVGEQTVNLIILLAVLAYYLKDPIRNFMVERRGIIGNEIEEARKTIEEARKKYQEYSEKISKMEDEIKSLQETLRKEGEVEREEIVRQAQAASQKIGEEARETIKLETAKARREIQAEAASLAVELAESIIKQNIKDSDEKRFMEDFIKKVEEEGKWHQ
jgi:F-type H+-transporting ATPase subunit b